MGRKIALEKLSKKKYIRVKSLTPMITLDSLPGIAGSQRTGGAGKNVGA